MTGSAGAPARIERAARKPGSELMKPPQRTECLPRCAGEGARAPSNKGTFNQPGREVLSMCLAFYVDPLLVATIAFPILFFVCILAALYFQERNKRL